MRIFGRSKLGNTLIVVGALLLLSVPASYGWTELQSMFLRKQLENEPPPIPVHADGAAGLILPVRVTSTPGAPKPSSLASPTAAPSAAPDTPQRASAPVHTDLPESSSTPYDLSQLLPAPTYTPRPTSTPQPIPTPSPTNTVQSAPAPANPPSRSGPPSRIVFPDLHIDTKVTPMGWTDVKHADGSTDSEWAVPANTAGWAITGAPLGVPGNIVLSGHNNIYGMVFRPISMAWPENRKQEVNAATYSSDILNGRMIQLYAANGRRFDYRVTGFYRLHDSGVPLEQRQENANYMEPTPDPELTLITCWPPWSNTHRLVVRAALVQP